MDANNLLISPIYCKYTSGNCDQDFTSIPSSDAFLIYPSVPPHLADTIKECVRKHNSVPGNGHWMTWEDLSVGGKIIICEICKAIRGSKLIVANITNMNFNVLFELGFAIGLNKVVIPIRDSTYESQKRQFDEIGIFDTLGYEKFTNSSELTKIIENKGNVKPVIMVNPEQDKSQPIFFIRSPIDTDGSIKIFSCLKKSWYRFRAFDSRETPRLSLHDSYKQVISSISVIAHLIDSDRAGGIVHNARSAFLCGMALAAGKHILMFQEGYSQQPIDYRDLIVPYTDTKQIPYYMDTIFKETADTLQTIEDSHVPFPSGLLARIDLGDVAAENEIKALNNYFVKTPQFQQARQGHARIVIGRKGAGKTALFYGIRSQFSEKGDTVLLDLKPDGHQFTRLREVVLQDLSEGMQLHTLTAFWHYLLLLEIAKKLIDKEKFAAYQNPTLLARFSELESLYHDHMNANGDFSERLMSLVNRLITNFPKKDPAIISSQDITSAIYSSSIEKLNRVLYEHLRNYQGVWILFDNLDKSFPTHGIEKTDILIIRCLLEATRKLQVSMESHNIDCVSTIFIRKDVYDHLIDETPDRGKESYVNLDWSDNELIQELLLKRIRYQASELIGTFEDVWSRLFEPNIDGENSFNYLLSKTLRRPRDILNIVRKCMQIAVSREHEKVNA